jgi:D-glycero-D-manno-heptose 1,7-bisphosphate phosphatase
MEVPVLYLDLDGTVRHGLEELGRYVNRPEDVVIFPEALVMMRRWKEINGGRIVGVSNQGGIALGHSIEAEVAATMARTQELTECLFDRIHWCTHHPMAEDPAQARCWCRKPKPGMPVAAAILMGVDHSDELYSLRRALMVGDLDSDRECARNAGVDFLWASEWRAQA